MTANLDQVIVTTEEGPCPEMATAHVRHRLFPEIRAEASSPREGAERLVYLFVSAMDGAGTWNRAALGEALNDVQAYVESLPRRGRMKTVSSRI